MRLTLIIVLGLAFSACNRPGDYPITTECRWVEDDHHSLDLVYVLGAYRVWIMALGLSVCVALVGVMLWKLGSILVEWVQLNSGHLSYRMARLPWRVHWVMLFGCGVVIFGLVALVRSRKNYESESIRRSDPRVLH